MLMVRGRFAQMFSGLKERNQHAFVPFVLLGYPNVEVCLDRIELLVECGADALEVGIPFSDPVADGPIIAGAMRHVRDRQGTPAEAWELVREVRRRHPALPIGALVYGNLIYGPGVERSLQVIVDCGVDAVLVPDVPFEESAPLRTACHHVGLQNVLLRPPQLDAGRARQISTLSEGFLYVVARSGVTGRELPGNSPEVLFNDHPEDGPPPLVGFGIGEPGYIELSVR